MTISSNDLVTMTHEEYKQIEDELQDLRQALVRAARKKNKKTKDIQVSMRTLYNLYMDILNRDEEEDPVNMDRDIYGHDVTVHFHGLYNNIIDGIKECADEYDG